MLIIETVSAINIFILTVDSRAGIISTVLHKPGSVESQGSSLQSRFDEETKPLHGNHVKVHQSYFSEHLQLYTRFS